MRLAAAWLAKEDQAAAFLRRSSARGDFNGDGKADLVLRGASEHAVWLMNGSMRTGEALVVPAPAPELDLRGVSDFDADGHSDLLFRNLVTGSLSLRLMNGPNRVALPPLTGVEAPSLEWDLAATGDFNGDTLPDLLWRNNVTQKLDVWLMDGLAFLGAVVPTPDQAVNSNWTVVAALDYDANGTADLLWYKATSGKIVQWLMNDAVVRTAGRFTDPSNAGHNNWKVVASGDYGADSALTNLQNDVVWRNDTSGKLVLWRLAATGVRTSGTFLTPDAPAPALAWTVVGPR